MEETAIVLFKNINDNTIQEIEVPLYITANDLVIALNQAFSLEMNVNDIFNCYLVAVNPIVFIRGNKTLEELGIRNGTEIIYKRDKDELSI